MMSDVGGNSVYIASLFDVSSATARARWYVYTYVYTYVYYMNYTWFVYSSFAYRRFVYSNFVY